MPLCGNGKNCIGKVLAMAFFVVVQFQIALSGAFNHSSNEMYGDGNYAFCSYQSEIV